LILFYNFLASVNINFYFIDLNLLPPLFLFMVPSGSTNGLTTLAYFTSYIFYNLFSIYCLNYNPNPPSVLYFNWSILLHLAILVDNILPAYFLYSLLHFLYISHSLIYPNHESVYTFTPNSFFLFWWFPNINILQAGVFPNLSTLPSVAINYAATLLPTSLFRFGAIISILLS